MSRKTSVPAATPTPTPTPRRKRIPDAETEQRMLKAAIAMVNTTGLTVSLDHISFEDVIRDADVSRSTVYRRWPHKDQFFNDLLRELAKGSGPTVSGNPAAFAVIYDVILAHLEWLRQPELRLALAAEALRRTALDEFDAFHASAEWRTYFALQATFLGLPDGELRNEIRTALTDSERVLTERVTTAYTHVAELIGLRLRPELNATFATVATLASATIRGLVLMAPTNPDIATNRFEANPCGAPEPAEWSQPALGLANVVLTFFEADPEIEWADHRIEKLRKSLVGTEG